MVRLLNSSANYVIVLVELPYFALRNVFFFETFILSIVRV